MKLNICNARAGIDKGQLYVDDCVHLETQWKKKSVAEIQKCFCQDCFISKPESK